MGYGSEQVDIDRGLVGHRATPLGDSPFARNAPAIGIAIITLLSLHDALPIIGRASCRERV